MREVDVEVGLLADIAVVAVVVRVHSNPVTTTPIGLIMCRSRIARARCTSSRVVWLTRPTISVAWIEGLSNSACVSATGFSGGASDDHDSSSASRAPADDLGDARRPE